jgi:hypothetical protein
VLSPLGAFLSAIGHIHINPDSALWTMLEYLARPTNANPKADTAQPLAAIGTWSFEQAPERRHKDHGDQDRKDNSDGENSRRISRRDSGDKKKSKCHRGIAVTAPFQILADRHAPRV